MFNESCIMHLFVLSSILLGSVAISLLIYRVSSGLEKRYERKRMDSLRKILALRHKHCHKQGHPWRKRRKNRLDVLVGKSGAIMYLPYSKLWNPLRCLALGTVCLLTLSGCASRQLTDSFCGPLPADDAVTMIAQDAVSTLTGLYPPGHTAIYLLPAQDSGNPFSARLENTLRGQGVTMLQADSQDALAVAFTLDQLQAEQGEDGQAWYLQLRLSDGRIISRSYNAFGLPEAGQSRTEAAVKRPLGEKLTESVTSFME